MAPIVTTIVTGAGALRDFRTLLFTLEQWYTDPPTVYVYTDSVTIWKNVVYKGQIIRKVAMDAYKGLNRQQMESIRGTLYPTLFADYTAEKIKAIRWAMVDSSSPVWFLDADITLLGPLPSVPNNCDLALSPHMIRPADEAKYGRYNAGFMWIGSEDLLNVWTAAMPRSRFFEQAALEEVAAAAENLYEFPIQNNFGWWRLWQSTETSEKIVREFGLNRMKGGVGITFRGEPLGSVHTHWSEERDLATAQFNQFIMRLLKKLSSHKPAAALFNHIDHYTQGQ